MASLQFESTNSRSSGYSVVNRDNFETASATFPRQIQRTSVISGLKSLFGSKSSMSSSKSNLSRESTYSSSQQRYGVRFGSISRPKQASGAVLRRVSSAQVKTCDAFPILSPQLEERMLQLADRSRRLGVHRFSRTRNALLLNEHTTPSAIQVSSESGTRSVVSSRFLSGGSSTSLSTQSSTPFGGTIQRVPKLSDSRYTSAMVRE